MWGSKPELIRFVLFVSVNRCCSLTKSSSLNQVGKNVMLCGWVQHIRNFANQRVFIVLRDRSGTIQLSVEKVRSSYITPPTTTLITNDGSERKRRTLSKSIWFDSGERD